MTRVEFERGGFGLRWRRSCQAFTGIRNRAEDNLSTVARLYYAASALVCCAHAISEGGQLVLGAQAGEARLAEVFRKAGFTHFRRAAETPFNLIFETRP